MKEKEQARTDFVKMIYTSWTYERLTDDERERLEAAFDYTVLSGTYQQRQRQLHSTYQAFLLALLYQPIGWRESANSEAPLF